MSPVLKWLLEMYCRENQIDIQEIDSKLTFAENKEALERKFGQLSKPSIYKKTVKALKSRKGWAKVELRKADAEALIASEEIV